MSASVFFVCWTFYISGMVSTSSSGNTLNVTAMPGTHMIRNFTVYTQPVNFSTAQVLCYNSGGYPVTGWNSNWIPYVKEVISRDEKYNFPQGVWLGSVKVNHSNDWTDPFDCGISFGSEKAVHNVDPESFEYQCAFINLSTPNTMQTNVYAKPCCVQLPFLCVKDVANNKDTSNAYQSFDNVEVPTFVGKRSSKGITTFKNCLYMFFAVFLRYMLEYQWIGNNTGECFITAAKEKSYLPVTLLLEPSVNNVTLVFKTQNYVIIDDSALQPNYSISGDFCLKIEVENGFLPTECIAQSPVPTAQADNLTTTVSSCCCPWPSVQKGTGNITIKELKLNRRNLTSYRRTKISAFDHRQSSQFMGYFASAFLLLCCFLVLASDIQSYLCNGKYHIQQAEKRENQL